MKKKVIIFSVLAAMIMLVGMFAMLSDAKALVIVPASLYATGPFTSFTYGTITVLPSGLWYYSGWGASIANALVIGLKTYSTINTCTFTGYYNPTTKVAKWYWDVDWSVVGNPSGGFKGWMEETDFNFIPATWGYSYATLNVFARGFGCFAGETLILHCAGSNVGGSTWTGYCIIP